MKKVLAIVLTLAMLLSCMIVGLSAARVVTENKTTNHYWTFPEGNSWHPVKFNNPSSTVEMDVRFDAANSTLGCYGLSNAPSMSTSYIGLKDNSIKIDHSFSVGVWYHVKYVSANGSTEIFVDGASIGSVSAEISYYDNNQFYWSPVLMSMDNVSVGGQVFDFEGDNSAWNTESGQGQVVLEENVTYANENVYSVPAGSKYLRFDADHAYLYSDTFPVGPSNGYTTFTFKVRFNDATSETRSYMGSDIIVSPTKIGIGGQTAAISPALSLNEWHEISFNCYNMNGASFYKIDGGDASVTNNDGMIAGIIKSTWCGGAILVDFDDFVVKSSSDGATYETICNEDFEDGKWDAGHSDCNGFVAQDTKEVRVDLGLQYWTFPSGNSYNPVDVGSQSNFDVEMDIKLDDAAGRLYTGWASLATAPYFAANGIGVGENAKIAGTYEVGEWYHVKWANKGDGTTDCYVNGALVGNVAATVSLYEGTQAFWQWDKISIDNLKVGTYSNDMEGSGIGGQGQIAKYEIKVDSIFDHFETKTPGGEAYVLENTPEYGKSVQTYVANESIKLPASNNFIMNFDLALLPVNDHSDGACFEIWTNKSESGTDIVRWKVGTTFYGMENGSTKDYSQFNWGDATKDNFHNITYVMKRDYDVAEIYIDKELVYTGRPYNNTWEGMCLMMGWNADVIIDNLQVMDLKYNPIEASFNGVEEFRAINLDAEDFCATNGHLNGFLTRTAEPKCYEEGTDTIVCAVCGATKSTSPVAKTAHNWGRYDINRKTSDGLVYAACSNDGCTEKRYTTLPTAYAGTLYEYYDMSDDMVLVVSNDWSAENWTSADGVLKFEENKGKNYNIFDMSDSVPANNWAWNLDIIYRGTFDDSDTNGDNTDARPGYGHVLYFWIGGSSTIGVRIGYNADEHKLYVVDGNASLNPTRKNPFPDGNFKAKTVDFTMVEGEVYNFAVTMTYNNDGYPDDESKQDQWDACLRLYVNGEVKLEFSMAQDGTDAFFNIPYGEDHAANLDSAILRDFGIIFDIKSMAFGSADFAYTDRAYNGDVDGDNAITAADALLMRKYLARVIDLSALVSSRADANGDGAINAKDQLVIRKTLAA